MIPLSQAIRLGLMLKPQGKGNVSAMKGATRTCALGAAGDAIGKWFDGNTYEPLRKTWPILSVEVRHPINTISGVINIIIQLNDHYGWTREQIADFVQSIEAQQEGMHPETGMASAVEIPAEANA